MSDQGMNGHELSVCHTKINGVVATHLRSALGDVCDFYFYRQDEHGINRDTIPYVNSGYNAERIKALWNANLGIPTADLSSIATDMHTSLCGLRMASIYKHRPKERDHDQNEIIAAAKRLKSDSWEVYGQTPRTTDEWLELCDNVTADGAMLADAFLAEIDDSPMTVDKFVALGAERHRGKYPNYVLLCGNGGVLVFDENTNTYSVGGSNLKPWDQQIPTVGQVRTLCRALGIELKDGNGK